MAEKKPFIKVIGVGGGGGNAVNHMYEEGINNVSFALCNTDYQDLERSPVPVKIQIGPQTTFGLGCGAKPEVGRKAAEESREEIRALFDESTKMAFITAGMGGGTGTGAAPVIAGIAKEMNVLTVGIVTIPFRFEMSNKIQKALEGVKEMKQNVDALLVINNEKLMEIYGDLTVSAAFKNADGILTESARGIADIITQTGQINLDFADVRTVLKDSGVAIMNTGEAQGDNRIRDAIAEALRSPLLNNNDITGAKRVLLYAYASHEFDIAVAELSEIRGFLESLRDMHDDDSDNMEFIWGMGYDDSLDETVRITIIATGFGLDNLTDESDPDVNSIEALFKTFYKREDKKEQAKTAEAEQEGEAAEDAADAEEEEEEAIDLDDIDLSSLDADAPEDDIDKPAYKK